MDNNQHLPPSAQMLQTTFGFTISRAISVAAQFRIADYLKDGPKTAVELAQLAGVHPVPFIGCCVRFQVRQYSVKTALAGSASQMIVHTCVTVQKNRSPHQDVQ
jgi:hypothetical protein